MPDDLGSQNIIGQGDSNLSQPSGAPMPQANAEPSSLSTPRAKSPLEEAGAAEVAEAPTGPTAAQTEPAATPEPLKPATGEAALEKETQSPLEQTNGREAQPPAQPADLGDSSQAPETDEFLKSIMGDQAGAPAPTPEAGQPAPTAPGGEPPLEPTQPPPAPETPPPSEAPAPTPSEPMPPAEAPETAQPGQPVEATVAEEAPAPKIKDEVGNLDGIVGSQPPPEAPEAAPPETPEEPAVPGAAPSPEVAAKPKSNVRLLLIIAAIVLLVGGGWYVYTTFFAAPAPVATTTTTASVTPTATVQPLTVDETRKKDLLKIADALKNIMAGEKAYPISEKIIMLNDPNNLLTKALVPAYLDAMPQDPDPTNSYAYKSDGHTFLLTAVLDDKTDPDGVLEGNLYLFKVTQDTPTTSAATTNPATPATAQSPSNSATVSPTVPTGGSSAPATPDLDLPI